MLFTCLNSHAYLLFNKNIDLFIKSCIGSRNSFHSTYFFQANDLERELERTKKNSVALGRQIRELQRYVRDKTEEFMRQVQVQYLLILFGLLLFGMSCSQNITEQDDNQKLSLKVEEVPPTPGPPGPTGIPGIPGKNGINGAQGMILLRWDLMSERVYASCAVHSRVVSNFMP